MINTILCSHSGHIILITTPTHPHTNAPPPPHTHTHTYKHKQTCTTHAWHNTPATLPTSGSRERPGLSHWLGPLPCGCWVCVPVHIWRPLGRSTPALTFKPTVWRIMTNCCTFQAWIVPWMYVYHVCVPLVMYFLFDEVWLFRGEYSVSTPGRSSVRPVIEARSEDLLTANLLHLSLWSK